MRHSLTTPENGPLKDLSSAMAGSGCRCLDLSRLFLGAQLSNRSFNTVTTAPSNVDINNQVMAISTLVLDYVDISICRKYQVLS